MCLPSGVRVFHDHTVHNFSPLFEVGSEALLSCVITEAPYKKFTRLFLKENENSHIALLHIKLICQPVMYTFNGVPLATRRKPLAF